MGWARWTRIDLISENFHSSCWVIAFYQSVFLCEGWCLSFWW
jgi:hypothetical protein